MKKISFTAKFYPYMGLKPISLKIDGFPLQLEETRKKAIDLYLRIKNGECQMLKIATVKTIKVGSITFVHQ